MTIRVSGTLIVPPATASRTRFGRWRRPTRFAAAAGRKPLQESAQLLEAPVHPSASDTRLVLTLPAGSSILRAAPDWATGPAPAGLPRPNLRGTNRVEILSGSLGKRSRPMPTTRPFEPVASFFAADRHRRGKGVYQTRHVRRERPEQPARRVPTTVETSLDHRYSPYRTCVSFDWSLGGFLGSHDASRPMMVVLSHSHSRSTRSDKINRPS